MPNAKPAIAPRARPARRSFARAGRLTIAAGPGAGTTTSPAWWKRRLSTPPGWNACRTAFRTARPRRPYERSAIWTSPNFRRSFRRAASAGIDHPSLTLTHVMHRDLPRPSLRATPKALRYGRGSLLCMTWISSRPPPMRGHDWTRKGGRNWKRFDTERAQRRIQRHLLEARLPPGKTLGSFDFATVPMVSHAHVTALASGDAWLKKGANILLFGPSGSGKSHLGAALGHALIENGYRVLFTRTTDLVQRLQTARQALLLENVLEKLDKYHLIILDDLCYVNRDQAETSVLFELIAARYERRSLLVTSNRPFGEWTTVFPDAAMTLAAVDRLVHHAVILEMNVQSYRQRSAATRQQQRTSSDSKRDTKQKEIINASST